MGLPGSQEAEHRRDFSADRSGARRVCRGDVIKGEISLV
jgi:hypothetical protein